MQDHVLAAVSLGCGCAVSPDGKGRLIGAHGHSLPARAKTAKEISHGLTPGAMALVTTGLEFSVVFGGTLEDRRRWRDLRLGRFG